MKLEDKIKKIIGEQGFDYQENVRTIYTTCPSCGRDDKFSILKDNGACVCYRSSCDFGKQWFEDWISLTAKISRKEANKLLHGYMERKTKEGLPSDPFKEEKVKSSFILEKIDWPIVGFEPIDSELSIEGANYLISRGIPISVANHYDIRYSPWFRRVIFPIKMNGSCYGWQGRAIDPVLPKDRMRNNVGFRRDSLIMFLNEAYGRDYLILLEGPIDALKFHWVGGAIASMGKIVAENQLKLINNSNIKTLYIGFDDDAAEEMMELRKRLRPDINMKLLTVPESCVKRCESLRKKADFGECTFEEGVEAFRNAIDFGSGHILLYFKKK